MRSGLQAMAVRRRPGMRRREAINRRKGEQ